jgi:hypothetical protein
LKATSNRLMRRDRNRRLVAERLGRTSPAPWRGTPGTSRWPSDHRRLGAPRTGVDLATRPGQPGRSSSTTGSADQRWPRCGIGYGHERGPRPLPGVRHLVPVSEPVGYARAFQRENWPSVRRGAPCTRPGRRRAGSSSGGGQATAGARSWRPPRWSGAPSAGLRDCHVRGGGDRTSRRHEKAQPLAGFEVLELDRFPFKPHPYLPARAHILGRARRLQGSKRRR